ncbi:non-canonical purine NTP pyrophosphatase [Candidatus Peregrinibacteria bacterium CG11_big_fil_rev_8_21_14_0_20_46_8]|nr:MAG: non-canonical purine NTP pyrophosphatase [Candidatus Peregrinibacteria bacterium CG11_big_fil_rev_8_21_14_0_20_46_8]
MKLLIATHNVGKLSEMVEVLGSLPIEILSLNDLNLHDDVEETGETHEENALLKAKFFAEKSGLPTLGEDSGVYVDAFPGELGVQTRRWEGLHHATDAEWVEYFLNKMEGESNRNARFVSVAAFVSGGEEKFFRGETLGTITHTLEAPLKKGIPVSSCFRPEGSDKVYAALSPHEKNQLSHRGKAMHQVYEFLKTKI